ncbi:MAG: cation transporter, partial [Pseudomonadota bacterium]|nr:cation transporter [Pseudomonadota bacterium]
HARVDGLTSIAVVLGAFGVWLGFPLADPIVGLVITVMIFGIVWQSAKAVFTRMLDGVEPKLLGELRHAAEHVSGIRAVGNLRARWLGHRLYAEADITVDADTPLQAARALADAYRSEAMAHMPALHSFRIGFAAAMPDSAHAAHGAGHPHHAS